MSHYTTIKTTMRDREILAVALRDLYPDAIVDVRDKLTISGYGGRLADAQVAVRKVGLYGEDIGFAAADDGTLSMIVDSGTNHRHAETLRRLPQRYSYHSTTTQARRLGFAVTNEQTIAAPAVATVGR